MRRPALPLLTLLAALACSHAGANRSGRTVALAAASDSTQEPLMTCADAKLSTSSLVERVRSRISGDRPRRRFIELRNPPSVNTQGVLFRIEPMRGAPRELVVEFSWPGHWEYSGGMKPAASREESEVAGETLRDIATRLLQLVQAGCARSAVGEPVCVRIDDGRTGHCSVGL